MFRIIKLFIRNTLINLYRLAETWHHEERYSQYKTKFDIAPDFRFNGPGIFMYGNGEISIKKNSYLGAYSSLATDEGYKIEIGEGCAISHNVKFYTNSYIADQDFSIKKRKMKYGNVIVEDNVWIGANVYIGCNVIIGQNAIIGANSVVTSDIEANGIYSGIPAKLIRFKKG